MKPEEEYKNVSQTMGGGPGFKDPASAFHWMPWPRKPLSKAKGAAKNVKASKPMRTGKKKSY